MQGNKTVHFVDVETDQNQETGYRDKIVTHKLGIRCEVSPVGSSTFWNASSQKIKLDLAVKVKTRSYKNQKYFVVDGSLYEVHNVGKGKDFSELTVFAFENTDDELKELILDAVGIV